MKKKTNSRLFLLAPKLATQIQAVKNNKILRLFACNCAALAFKYCGNKDDRLLAAIEIGQQYALGQVSDTELNKAYIEASQAAEIADGEAFDINDAVEENKMPTSRYSEAFGMARAAFSARDCCDKPAIKAANNAAYEAWAALSTAIERGNTLGDRISLDISDSAINDAIIALLEDILEDLTDS